MPRPWLRKATLYVWPTSEAIPTVATGTALRFDSDGTLDTFYMRFTVHQSIVSAADGSTIVLANLSPETLKMLRTPNLQCRLDVGWEEYKTFTIYEGALLFAASRRYGPDILTTLNCFTGAASLLTATVSRTWGAGTAVKQIVSDLADLLPGVARDPSLRRIDSKAKVGDGGWSFTGLARDALDKLGAQYHFNWSVSNGKFWACDDRADLSSVPVLELSAENGVLLSVTPMLNGPAQVFMGIEVRSLIVPGAFPAQQVLVKSAVDERLNGLYRIHSVDYAGSPREQEWSMTSQCYFWDKKEVE